MMPEEKTSITIKATKNVPNIAPMARAWVSGWGMANCRKVKPSMNIHSMPPQRNDVSTTINATRKRASLSAFCRLVRNLR